MSGAGRTIPPCPRCGARNGGRGVADHYLHCGRYRKRPPIPVPPTARPAAGDTRGDRERLREAVARWLFENTAWTPYVWDEGPGGISEQHRDEWREDADRLLALPELAALLDAAEILTAVRELHHRDDTEPYACDYCGQAWPCDVIHALDTALADQP